MKEIQNKIIKQFFNLSLKKFLSWETSHVGEDMEVHLCTTVQNINLEGNLVVSNKSKKHIFPITQKSLFLVFTRRHVAQEHLFHFCL